MEAIKVWVVIASIWIALLTVFAWSMSSSVKFLMENSTDNWKADRELWTEIKDLYVEQQNIMAELKAIKECQ